MQRRKIHLGKIALLVVLILSMSGCSTEKEKESKKDTVENDTAQEEELETEELAANVLKVSVGKDPKILDPALNTTIEGATYLVHGFEGLMKRSPEGNVVEGQAESYHISEDGKTYTFILREDALWSDGENVVADDFVYAWERIRNAEVDSDYGYLLEDVLEMVAVNEKTFKVTLTKIAPYFLEVCTLPALSPVREDVVADDEEWAKNVDSFIGNGPYLLAEWEPKTEIVFTKNETYYGVEEVGFDEIRFQLTQDEEIIKQGMHEHTLSFVNDIENVDLSGIAGFEKKITNQFASEYLCINGKDGALLDVRVRQALALAIDRNKLMEQTGVDGISLNSFLPQGMYDGQGVTEDSKWWDSTLMEENIQKAKELLQEVGYQEGNPPPAIELLVDSGRETMAKAVAEMWNGNLGISTKIIKVDWNTYLGKRKVQQFQVARYGWGADYKDPISFLKILASQASENDMKFANETYDQLVLEMDSTMDLVARTEKAKQAEAILFEQMPMIPLYQYTNSSFTQEGLQNVYVSQNGTSYFMYAHY